MNITKFTQNSQNSVNMAQQYAVECGNQEIEEEHLLYALITIDDSLILKLIEKMEINTEHFKARVKEAVEKREGEVFNRAFICQRKCEGYKR